jgi:uncharacterized protein (DUF983 family)
MSLDDKMAAVAGAASGIGGTASGLARDAAKAAIAGARPERNVTTALSRGLRCRCPNCGQGRLFGKFLTVDDYCRVCNTALYHQRADDAPPYFVILITGHIMVPLALIVETAFSPSLWVHALLWGPSTVLLALGLLQPVKGALIGWQWANYMHGFDPDSDDDMPPEPVRPGDR